MRRKQLWKKISYITVSGVLTATVPVAAVTSLSLVRAEEGTEPQSAETPPPQTNPPETPPPETNPPETAPPQTDPPETAPPQTDPPETAPPQTDPPETPPSETQPSETELPPSESEMPSEPVTEPETEPGTQPGTESETPAPDTEPETEPLTETQSETSSETESASETTESETDKEKKETETETESELETEDHSLLNANWKTNIIASNAAYLGQLSSAYGISIADSFRGACSEVEKLFAQTLADPAAFQATNWRDVFAVFIYECKQRTGAANLSVSSIPILLEVFTEMNAPDQAIGVLPQVPDITEIFVEEYPIEEELEKIDQQEELLLTISDQTIGGMNTLEEMFIHADAQKQREAQKEEQKAQMDKARYEKWLRQKQEGELQQVQAPDTYYAADITARTIDDYVKMKGIDAAGRAEIERYASVECLQLCAIASAEPQIVRASVGNSVSEERVRIVTAAYSLVGKVGYFWGGKSYTFGWDPRWGSPATVTAAGSTSSGMTRKYGLDCSGFTLYCYYNGLHGSDAGIGGHTTSQWNATEMVSQEKAQPGDLVFYGGPERGDNNHVGVVVGKSTDGGLIVAHCSSSRNGVVVGEAWSSGFRYVRTVKSLR